MKTYAYTSDARLDVIPRLGLIVLQADETIEEEFRIAFKGIEASFHVSRIASGVEVSTNSLAQMEHDLPTAAGLFPRGVVYDVVGYGCTSATSVLGANAVHKMVQRGVRARHFTDPLTATIAWCRHHKIDRLAILSPYVEEVNTELRNALAEAGIQTPVFGSFNVAQESAVARISEKSIIEAGIDLCDSGKADALFLSCTNLRTQGARAAIRSATGLSVMSSNSALYWHMKHLLGV